MTYLKVEYRFNCYVVISSELFESGDLLRAVHLVCRSVVALLWSSVQLIKVRKTSSGFEIGHDHIPYRTKIRRTKLSNFPLGVKKIFRRKILSVENFAQCFDTKVRQKSDISVEISAWCRKFCPTKYFVRRKFCLIFKSELLSLCL